MQSPTKQSPTKEPPTKSPSIAECQALVATDDISFEEMKKQVYEVLQDISDTGEDVQDFLYDIIRETGGDPENPPPQFRHLAFTKHQEAKKEQSPIARIPIQKTPEHIAKMEQKKQSIINMVSNYNKQRLAKIEILKAKLREIDEKSRIQYEKMQKKKEKRRKKKQRHLALKRKKKELELKRKYEKQKAANRRKKLKAKQKAYKRKKEQEQLQKQQIEKQKQKSNNNNINKLDQLYEEVLLERQKQIQTQQIKVNNCKKNKNKSSHISNKQSKNNISKKKRKLPAPRKKKKKFTAPPGLTLTNKKPYQAQTSQIIANESGTPSNDGKLGGDSKMISDECVLDSNSNSLQGKRGVNDKVSDKLTFDALYDYVSDYDCGSTDVKYDYSDSENEIDMVLKNIVFGNGTDCVNERNDRNDINYNGDDEFIFHLPHGIVSVPNVVQQYGNDNCVNVSKNLVKNVCPSILI